MERSSSPTPSTRDLIRSYTTTSDESAADRIAAARAAREQRRREREAEMGDREDYSGAAHDALPRFEVHEADSQDGRSSFGGSEAVLDDAEGGPTTRSPVTKLRVEPTSDQSYTPSVPSTPSRSQPWSSPHASPAVPLPQHDHKFNQADPPASPSSSKPRRSSFEVPEIPPIRPKSANPAGSPSTSPTATTPPGIPARASSSPVNVSFAGGLMERLKAQRAAKLAAETQAESPAPAPASPPTQPVTSEAGSTGTYTPLSEIFPLSPREGATPPTSPSQEPVPLDSPSVEAARPAGFRFPSLPSASNAAEDVKPVMEVGRTAEAVLLKVRRTVPSKVFGRDGEEHDFEFTQLSDVPEQSEQSSLSTWRDSVHQHRRLGSTSSAGRPVSSTFSAPVIPVVAPLRRSSLASSTSSVGHQRAAPPSRARPVISSSWSAQSTFQDTITQTSELGSHSPGPPDKRVDATSHLLGRSGSTVSIFPASSASISASSSAGSFSDGPAQHPSPTRRVSPEVARRAAQFAQVDIDAPPPSPTKFVFPRRPALPSKPPPLDKLPEQDQPSQSQGTPSAIFSPEPPLPSSSSRLAQASSLSCIDGLSRARSPPPSGSILCEGYLRVPSSDNPHAYCYADPSAWLRRYCVLTSSGLEFRPTDQDPGVRPSTAFRFSECSHVDERPAFELIPGPRPFAIVLKSGERLHFAAENRVERVKWVLALRDALALAVQSERPGSTRTLTPPGSRFSSTRGTVRSWTRDASNSENARSASSYSPGPLGVHAFVDDEESRAPAPRPASTTSSTSTSTSSLQDLPERATAHRGRYNSGLFGMYTWRGGAIHDVAIPSSFHSTGSDNSLPPLPSPKDTLATRAGHRRFQSDYAVQIDRPPVRPLPTRPSTTTAAAPVPPSTDKRELRASSSSSTYVSPAEVAALERELHELGDRARSKDFGRVKRDERYRRLQERLKVFQHSLVSASSVETASSASVRPDELALAEKVDYLLYLTKNLAENSGHASPPPRVASTGAEEQLMSRVEARIRDLLNNMEKPAPPAPHSSPSTIKARADPDNATLTTRAGVHSASERLEWQRDLERFKNEAAASLDPSASSAASPNTVIRERERASRKLQNLSPLSPNQLEPFTSSHSLFRGPSEEPRRVRDPFAGTGVVEPAERVEPPRRAPLPDHPHLKQPLHPYGDSSQTSGARSAISWAESDVSKVEQALFRILDGFEQQNGSLAQNRQHQERIGQVIGELAKWVTEDRSLRDAQFNELVGAVHGVVQHVAELPQRLLASLGGAEAGAQDEPPRPTFDHADGDTAETGRAGFAGEGAQSAEEGVDAGQLEADEAAGEPKKRAFGLNLLSSFVQLDQKLAAADAGAGAGAGGRLKGPRMPGIRLWGAPEPVGDRVNRWGGGAVGAKDTADKQASEEAVASDAEAANGPNGPVIEALKKDEKLGQALQAIADGSGDEVDAGTLSLAVFEILQTMREISKKQADQEAREKAERENNSGLTLKEKAELEAKRAEIARLERTTAMSAERTAKINEMVAQLAVKTEKVDQLLTQIARNVAEGKTTMMDPALSDEVKELLGGVRAGVDEHVKDFRSQLTSEVQRMFKEVGKLRDEKNALQSDIADLMAFQAKHGGALPKAAPPPARSEPPRAATKPTDPPKSGLPSSGFFGPRPMK
ncbi:hypothetical protein JCM3770_000966 [Rhodotorula araucariae]